MTGQPPRIAEWLLNRFGCGPNNEVIIGDLNEHYRQGRSRFWYWRQVVVAIVFELATETKQNKSLALRVLVSGWGIAVLMSLTFPSLLHLLRGNPRGTGMLPLDWTAVRWLHVRGWIVPAGDAFLMAGLACIYAFGLGWIIGRLNRPHHVRAVLIFSASWIMALAAAIVFVLAKTLSQWQSTAWRYDNPYFVAFALAGNIAEIVSALAGGLLSGPPAPPAISTR